jgi:hypothetical protein
VFGSEMADNMLPAGHDARIALVMTATEASAARMMPERMLCAEALACSAGAGQARLLGAGFGAGCRLHWRLA